MKDTANSPKVIGPGYRPDPPPKVVTPGCTSGDCGCEACQSSAGHKPSIVAARKSQSARGKVGVIQLELSVEARKTLLELGLRTTDGKVRKLSDSTDHPVTFTLEVYDALAEELLSQPTLDEKTNLWRLGMQPPITRVITPSSARPPVLDDERRRLQQHTEWLLMGGTFIPQRAER